MWLPQIIERIPFVSNKNSKRLLFHSCVDFRPEQKIEKQMRAATADRSQRKTRESERQSSWLIDGAASRRDHPVDVLTRQSKFGKEVTGALMGSMQEILNRFKKQQQKCQSTLKSIAADSKTSIKTTPPPAPTVVPRANTSTELPSLPSKFSNDTERLQCINRIRISPVSSQIKRVVDVLLKVCLEGRSAGQ